MAFTLIRIPDEGASEVQARDDAMELFRQENRPRRKRHG